MGPAAEQRALKLSIWVTAVTGVIGIAGGLMIRSQAIMFDGMYSFVDIILTFGALGVSKLLVRDPSRRFQYGYWHLEPLAGAIQSAILATACLYAVINAVQGLMDGGQSVAHGWGLLWAGMMFAAGAAMAEYMRRLARRQKSILLDVDYRGWLLSAVLSLGLLLAYGLAVLFRETRYERWIPYLAPGMLLLMALAILPMPIKTLVDGVREVLEVAPEDLDQRVRAVMDELVRERGFIRYTSHVSRVGRARFIEIHVLVPKDWRIETVQVVDDMRCEIGNKLNARWPETWLTVDFTGDPEWM